MVEAKPVEKTEEETQSEMFELFLEGIRKHIVLNDNGAKKRLAKQLQGIFFNLISPKKENKKKK